MRILLFLATNLAVVFVLGIVLSLLGFDQLMAANGIGINTTGTLVICAIFGFGGSLVSLFLSKWMARRGTNTQIIEQPRNESERWLLDTVAQLAGDAGIGMPEVGVFPSPVSNAFATGWNRNDALVAVSQGLLQRFNKDEIRAVLAHEIGHVANGDMVTLTMIQGVVNTFVLFFSRVIGHTVDRVVFKNERGFGPGYWIGTIVAQIVLSILASIIVMWFSRWREFRADAAGAKLAGSAAMIGALQRLQAEQGQPQDLPGELTAFGISEQLKEGAAKLFMSHPPLPQRIAALQRG